MKIIDKTDHMRPDKNGAYSFTLFKYDGTTLYREFKKKMPYLRSLAKRGDLRNVVVDLV